ncbi:Gfo/Idh/MocA family protein [Luteococcus sp. OSA5]|uniref:Gfo/Idh/MocA family protein n=1 Tax=Luteococcus sp. OSA5 TaxID=3401630 RepID=UPI003B43D4DB
MSISRPATTAAIVGCGDVSLVHFEAFQALGIELVGVVDVDPEGLARAKRMAPGVPGFASHKDLLAKVKPDVVHVTTPHHQHAQITRDLLVAGVHVIQEKPLANTLTAAQCIVEASQSSTSRLGICLQNRYNESSRAMKQVLEDGELGEVLGAYASVVWTRTPDYYQSKPWRGRWQEAGGGLLINQALHTLDLVQWFLGEPTQINGRAATLKYGDVIEVEDSCNAMFTHPASAGQPAVTTTFVGSLTNAVHRPVEIEVYGSKGTATIRNGLHLRFSDGRSKDIAERVVPSGGRSYWGMSHQALIEDFHSRLDDPVPFWIGAEEAMPSMRMLKTIYAETWPETAHHQ